MVLRFFLFASLFLFVSCHTVERDNPDDPNSKNYGKDDSSGSSINYGSIYYVSQTYKTVVIGEQTWMAENLNYGAALDTKCYSYINTNCNKYGRLYNWAAAMDLPASCNSSSCKELVTEKHKGICPNGWHIPNTEDMLTLMDYIEYQKSCSECAGKYLKTEKAWLGGESKNAFGFSALPGGYYRDDSKGFHEMMESGVWQIAEEYDDEHTYYMILRYDLDFLGAGYDSKKHLLSVRCLKN